MQIPSMPRMVLEQTLAGDEKWMVWPQIRKSPNQLVASSENNHH